MGLLPKKNNFWIKTIATLAVVFGLVATNVVIAAPLYNAATPGENFATAAETAGQVNSTHDIGVLVGKVVGVILAALGIIVLGYLIYGGVIWMTAAGNEDQVTKAKSIIRNGIIGVIVIASAYAISYFIITQVGGAVGIR